MMALAAVFVTLLITLGPVGARAQAPAGPTTTGDSLELSRQVRDAQRNFERTRRANLPAELEGPRVGCDERIGRYCYWYDPRTDSAPPESRVTIEARELLLRELAAAAEQLPADRWITGQQVRYLVEQGLVDSALTVALQCRAIRRWCDALRGFASHAARDFPGAESWFRQALEGMPDAERCDWTDLGPLLGDDARFYRPVPCARRDSLEERIWWLARPLYSRAGNDLRTEHYARRTMALLVEDAATPDGFRWGADREQLVLRFGWPTHWSRAVDQGGGTDPPLVLGHEASPSFWFFPTPILAEPWADVTQVRWNPNMEHPPARYAPAYTAGFDGIERVQFARFQRNDTTLTVAAYDLTPDSVFATQPADVRLALGRDPATPVILAPVSLARSRGVLVVRTPWRPAVVSLEAVGLDTPWVARRRVMAAPDPGGVLPVVSDILLFTPDRALPQSLDAALPTMLAASVGVGRRLGLYWEMYQRPDSTAPMEISVTVLRSGSRDPAIYPAGRSFCPFTSESRVRLRWVEQPNARPPGPGRAIVLDLGPLARGTYTVSVQLGAASRPRGCSSREFQIGSRSR